MTEILLVNPGSKHSHPNPRSLPPPLDDEDDIAHPKYDDYLPTHLVMALRNAGVSTIGELKRWAHSDLFRMTKNVGPVGRDHVRQLLDENIDGTTRFGLSVRAERGSMSGLARHLCETTKAARVDWFRALGKRLREGGFAHAIVDELEAYSE